MLGDRYAKLPYAARVKLKQARRLRKAANRAEARLWREGYLSRDQESVLYGATRRIREEAENAEREALCRSSES
jgi:hypothetical protein